VTTETVNQPSGAPQETPHATEETTTRAGRTASLRMALTPGRTTDLAAFAGYALFALYVTVRFWRDPNYRVLGTNAGDQGFYEWMLAYQGHVVSHLDNPFYTHMQNAPVGVNLMCNASVPLLGWLLAPLTLLFGSHVTFGVLLTSNLFLTAAAWYYVLSRHLVRHRFAALIGGAFCGFGPGMISQSSGHIHMTAAYLVPFIVWQVTRLGERGRVLRNGLILGLLVAAQLLIGEETLLLTAIACGVFVLVYAASRPREAVRIAVPYLSALSLGAIITLVIDGYPLWMQFFGPNHASGVPVVYGADLWAYISNAQQSIIGDRDSALRFSPNPSEQNSFFGASLPLLAIGIGIMLWRTIAARMAFVTALVCVVFSLQHPIVFRAQPTDLPAPSALLAKLPVIDALILSRLGLITMVCIGILLALVIDRVWEQAARPELSGEPVRLLASVVVGAVLLPLLPTPLPTTPREVPIPPFITSERWRDYVAEGRTMVIAAPGSPSNLVWGAAAGTSFAIVQGYFIYPTSATDTHARWGSPGRPTQLLMDDIWLGKPRTVGPVEREDAIKDLKHWGADAVVLSIYERHSPELRQAIEAMLGPPQQVDGVWLWDVRRHTR